MESFTVRAWAPEGSDGQAEPRLRGQLVRLATGTTHTFTSPEERIALTRGEIDRAVILPEAEHSRPLDDAPA